MLWYWDKTVFFYYVDNSMFMGPDSKAIDKTIEEIKKAGLGIGYKGNVEDCLGVNIEEKYNGKVRLT